MDAAPDTTQRAVQIVARLGQPIFGRATPDGWPDRGDAWMNSGAILGRINFGLMVAASRVPGVTMGHVPELEALKNVPREAQVDGVVRLFFGGQVSPDTRQILLEGENPLARKLSASSDTTNAMAAEPSMQSMTDATARNARPTKGGAARPAVARGLGRPVQLNGLAQVVGLAIGAPEFQRR